MGWRESPGGRGGLFAVLLVLASFGFSREALPSEQLKVYAASSLKTVMDQVIASWHAQSGDQAVGVYAASSALARQIEAGAPADVFLSADLEWMKYLADRSLIRADTETQLLGNSLALVVPQTTATDIKISPGFDIMRLLDGGRLAIGEVNSVPAGRYGKAALESLGVWDQVKDRLAQAENVRAALKLVASGEAPAGIVYETDARSDRQVHVAGIFPDLTHPPIIYPAAVVASSVNSDAEAFLRYLETPAARAIFLANGFKLLKGN